MFDKTYFIGDVHGDNLLQADVHPLAVFVQHHGVGISAELRKAQATVVLPLDLLDGILQQLPHVVHRPLIHGHLQHHM